jgi:spermidine synthase
MVQEVSDELNITSAQIDKGLEVFLRAVRVEVDSGKSEGFDVRLYQNLFYSSENTPIYEIVCDSQVVMSNYSICSEQILAKLAVEKSHDRSEMVMLIAGLGMGYTLQKALSYHYVIQVDVIEKNPTIVEWNKRYFAPINNFCLYDKRTKIISGDFITFVFNYGFERRYDAILVDIDNGPRGIVYPNNRIIYRLAFLKLLKNMLQRNGIIYFWSLYRDKKFMNRLERIFVNIEEHKILSNFDCKIKFRNYIYSAQLSESEKL